MDLFGDIDPVQPARTTVLAPGAVALHGWALDRMDDILQALQQVVLQAPFRHLITPGGRRMSVAMTNCGPLGWTSSEAGYAYLPHDPDSGVPWPAMPPVLRALAADAAAAAGYDHFVPDACLINRYAIGSRLSLHQDRDEHDLRAPIVSVSLGLPALFLWGGLTRNAPQHKLPLLHGDVVVWGGPSRLVFHGVAPVAEGQHGLAGPYRFNITFRKVRA